MTIKKIMTAPETLADSIERHELAIKTESVSSDIATAYWAELVPYPAAPIRLWLLVDGSWRSLENPNAAILNSVQEAFCNCPEKLEVAVWYSGSIIVGLVVRSK